MNKSLKQVLTPRHVIFADPDRAMVKISPDGKHLAFLGPKNGVLNIFIAKTDNPELAHSITNVSNERISSYFWSYKPELIYFLQDNNGDENHELYLLNVTTGESKRISAENAKVSSIYISPELPDHLIFTSNSRRADYFDVYEYYSNTQKIELIYENNEFLGFIYNEQLKIRFAIKLNTEGAQEIYALDYKFNTKLFDTIPYEDQLNSHYICLDKSAENIYLKDSRGFDKAKLFSVNLKSGLKTLLASDDRCDLSHISINQISREIEMSCFVYMKRDLQFFNDAFADDFISLEKTTASECEIISRTLNDDKWIVASADDCKANAYYIFDRINKKLTFLYYYKDSFKELHLAKMHGVEIKTRDDLTMVCYLSLPANTEVQNAIIPKNPLPLILFVHGGPQARDHWGMNNSHQWLSNRGYAVLSVNYRGSTGFGKSFTAAGNGQWSKKMHDDLIDAVNWAVGNKIAIQDKVAIMGGSYGGYAALVGLTFTPEVFTCAIDIVGPSNLVTLAESIPPYWKPIKNNLVKMLGGDNETEEGKAVLKALSPLTYANKIVRPLLIGQGANDPRVKQAESDQIFAALESNKVPVTYVLFDDEGHGFSKPKNRLLFYAICEEFLHKYLGGQYEPYNKDLLNEYTNVTIKSVS